MREGDIVRIPKISKVNTLLVSLMMMAILLGWSSQVQAAQDGDYTYPILSTLEQGKKNYE
jgi:hypothetical protein